MKIVIMISRTPTIAKRDSVQIIEKSSHVFAYTANILYINPKTINILIHPRMHALLVMIKETMRFIKRSGIESSPKYCYSPLQRRASKLHHIGTRRNAMTKQSPKIFLSVNGCDPVNIMNTL